MSAPAAPKAFVVGPVLAALAAFAFGAGCTDSLSQGPEPTGDAGAPASPTAACIDGKPTRPYPDGPHRIAQGETLPDLTFDGVRGDGTKGPFALRELYEPCAPSAKLAVLRVQGGEWCGTCLWHAAHGHELLEGPLGARISLVDLVVRAPDADRVRPEDLPGFRRKVDRPERIPTLADPGFSLSALAPASGAPLPLVVLVDVRTMKVVGTASNPSPDALAHQLETALAKLDGAPVKAASPEPLVDGHFTRDEWDMVRDMGAAEALPRDPSNAKEDDPNARALGAALFADTGFSPSNDVSCATCHDAKKSFSDGLPRPSGPNVRGSRRTPRIALAAYARWQFWDGRADSLWAQALGPFENPDEIASSRVAVVRRLATTHKAAFEAAFPAVPLPDPATLPAGGKPGDPTYDALPAPTREAVTRAFVDAGKAIAAFERTLPYPKMRLDAYARGDAKALSEAEKSSLSVFMQTGCAQCHFGPRLTNDAFHAVRMPTGRADGLADRGRRDGLTLLAKSEFSRGSRYADAPAAVSPARDADDTTLGAFKTPSLRGVAGGGPFGHGGAIASLIEVTEHYGRRGLPEGDPRTTGTFEPWLPHFDEAAQWALVPFLESLKAE